MLEWRGKRVVVTGGAGFLGRHVVERLAGAGCEVLVVRRAAYDLVREENVARLFQDVAGGRFEAEEGRRLPARPADVVVHLAGLVGGIGANKSYPADFFYQNLVMGVVVMDHAWRHGAKKFVAAGAGCGYPERAPLPLREESFWDGLPQQESLPYSLAKRMLQVQSIAYWRQHRFPSVITVPGNIYGPYDNFDLEAAHVVPALVRKFVEATSDRAAGRVVVWGSGAPTRDFVYAGDVAEGILQAGAAYEEARLVNLASGRETSIREVVETLAELTGFKGEIVWDRTRPDGQARRVFDISQARRDLGFEPHTSLRDGLWKTVEWYRAHRSKARNGIARAG